MRVLTILAVLMLGACAGNREIQYDSTGSDEMRRSPCACVRLPYDPLTFRWSAG